MMRGYARVSTDGQALGPQVESLTAAGAAKVYRETASGAKRDRAQLAKLLREVEHGDVGLVTRLDRLARSTRDLLNVLAALTDRGAAFRSLGDAWADTTTLHGRLMLTVLAGLAEFERELTRGADKRRTCQGQGGGQEDGPAPQAHAAPAARGAGAAGHGREPQHRAQHQRPPRHHRAAVRGQRGLLEQSAK